MLLKVDQTKIKLSSIIFIMSNGGQIAFHEDPGFLFVQSILVIVWIYFLYSDMK